MAKYYSTVRTGKTIRERLELLLDADPYRIECVAPATGLIESSEEFLKEWPTGNPEPLVYNHQKPDEVKEFFAALLEIFSGDREEEPENRRVKEAAKWHEVIDELERRFTLFKNKVQNPINSELTAVKGTAKNDLDRILVSKLAEWEQPLIEIGVTAFHSVNQSPQAIATYITDKLEAQRKIELREQYARIKSNQIPLLSPFEKTFIHIRFFQAFVGYKCEELKHAIDNYQPQTKGATSSLEQVPEEWPLREDFFEWLRDSTSPVQLLLLACRVNQFDPYRGMKSYQRNEVTELLKRLTGRTALREFSARLARIQSECNSLDELGALLIKKPGGETASRLLKELKNASLNAEARNSIDVLLLLRIN